MLNVQNYLQSHNYNDLRSEFGIEHKMSEDFPLVILDYNMYSIPPGKKSHPIIRECRGITLDSRDNSLVAKAFDRFFNYGEIKDDSFDFSDFSVQAKEDGSLIKIYFFENCWHINTRFSFAQGLCCDSEFRWQDIVLNTLRLDSLDDFDKYLNRNLTYICELCSQWNRVVREYKEPTVFLLSVFEKERELPFEESENESSLFQRPQVFSFKSIDEIIKFLDSQEEGDPSFEGFVIRDRFNNRLKIKNKSYLKLSYYFGKDTGFHPRHLIVLVHDGDTDELLTYYPNIRPAYEKVKEKIDEHFEFLWNVFKENAHKDKRAFHESVVNTPLYSIAETLYKLYGSNATKDDMFKIWIQNEDRILRDIFGVTASEYNLRHKPNYRNIRRV